MAGPGSFIGSLFRPTQQVTPAPNNQQQPQGNGPGSSMQQQPGNFPGGQPQGNGNPPQNPPADPNVNSSPLDAFNGLWDTPDPTKAAPDPFAQPLLPTDPAKLLAATKSVNFLQDIPQELTQRVMAGNDPQALMDLVNSVAQNALGMSLQLSTAAADKMSRTAIDRVRGDIPNQIKDWNVNNLPVDDAALQHPAAQPLLRTVMSQIKMKNPNLSPQEIQTQARKYLTDFASTLTGGAAAGAGGPGSNAGNPNSGSADWENFLNG